MTNGSLDGAGESDYEGVTVWIGDAADGDVGLDDDRRGPKPAAVPFEGGRSSDASTNVPLRRCREAFGAKKPALPPSKPASFSSPFINVRTHALRNSNTNAPPPNPSFAPHAHALNTERCFAGVGPVSGEFHP